MDSWRELIVVAMWNVCYLAKILIYFVVNVRYLVVTADYCLLPGVYWWLYTARYWWLLFVYGGYRLLLLVPTFYMNHYLDVDPYN